MSSRTQAGRRILERIAREEYGASSVEWRVGGKHIIALVTLPGGVSTKIATSKNVSGDTHNLGNFVRQHLRRAQAQAA